MPDYPFALTRPPTLVISTASLAAGTGGPTIGIGYSTVTGTWPSANLAFYIPFSIETTVIAQKMAWENGGTVAGTVDVGIYDINKNLLVSLGATSQTGTSSIQFADITDTTLTPGNYYMAMLMSDASTALAGHNANLHQLVLQTCGVQQQAVGAANLPSSATFANPGQTYLPTLAIATQATI